MTILGRVLDGKVVTDEPIPLPDGTEVKVEAATTFLERHSSWIGQVDNLPPDGSINHDHYLYGAPKRS